MVPPPAALRWGMASLATMNMPVRLTSITALQVSTGMSATVCLASE